MFGCYCLCTYDSLLCLFISGLAFVDIDVGRVVGSLDPLAGLEVVPIAALINKKRPPPSEEIRAARNQKKKKLAQVCI